MQDSRTFELASGTHTVTRADLEQIKVELQSALRNKLPAVDYLYLLEELENRGVTMFPKNSMPHIGQWAMLMRDGKVIIERQQVPRARFMRFYSAELLMENGKWIVVNLGIKHVWAAT